MKHCPITGLPVGGKGGRGGCDCGACDDLDEPQDGNGEEDEAA